MTWYEYDNLIHLAPEKDWQGLYMMHVLYIYIYYNNLFWLQYPKFNTTLFLIELVIQSRWLLIYLC